MLFGICIEMRAYIPLGCSGIRKDNTAVLAAGKVNGVGLPGIVVRCFSHVLAVH